MTTNYASYLEKGGGRLKKFLAVSATALIASVMLANPAWAAVKDGRSIEVFHGIEFVGINGYPGTTDIKVDVLRGPSDVIVGSTTQRTNGAGLLEINHVGGGQFPGGDCWGPDPDVTPDIMPGDTVRTTVLDGAGNATNDIDSTVVRDIFIDTDATTVDTAANTITMTGHVRSLPNAPIDPAADILELRMNANGFTWDANAGRRDLRENVAPAEIAADGTFTHVFQVSNADADNADANGFEQAFEWSAVPAGGGDPNELTVFDGVEGALAGCPAKAEDVLTTSSHEVVNIANVGRDMILSGVSFGATGVNVSVPGGVTHAATITPVNAAAPDEHQTWSATIPAAELGSLPQGRFQASAAFEGPGVRTTPSTLSILKDTVAPGKPTATPGAGRYERVQRVTLSGENGASIHYTVNGSLPTAASRAFGSPIPVTATQTIRARVVDGVGNPSQVSNFRYTILKNSFVSINRRPVALNLGQKVLVQGRVFPAHPGKVVRITVTRPGPDLVRNVRVRANAKYVFVYKPNRPGRHFVQARFLGDADHAPSTSVRKTFVVRR